MTIGTKLRAGTAGLILLAVFLSWNALSSIASLKGQIDNIIDATAKKQELASAINTLQSKMISNQRATVLYGFLDKPDQALEMAQTFRSQSGQLNQKVDEMTPLLITAEGRNNNATIKALNDEWLAEYQEVVRLAAAGRATEAWDYARANTNPVFEEIETRANDLVAQQIGFMADDKASSASAYDTNWWMTIGLICLSVVIGAVVVLLVQQVTNALRQAATELSDGSDQVASAATQVSSASQSLAQGASEQAASIEETSASSEEITSMTRKNAENSRTAAGVMGEVDHKVGEANRTLEEMVGSMQEINASSDKISRIIKVIDEIAFQTNILALNAAVEAARAGEAGMGFAVVADEVRNLAQRSAQAAKDTAGLIEESIARSSEGSTKLDDVTKAIRGITESAVKVKTLVDEVNVGSQEQSRGMEQIAKAITQMEQVTQKNAANAEQSAAASEELASQAETMKAVVDRLQAMVGGSGSGGSSSGPKSHIASASSSPGLTQLGRAVSHGDEESRSPASFNSRGPSNEELLPMDEEFQEF